MEAAAIRSGFGNQVIPGLIKPEDTGLPGSASYGTGANYAQVGEYEDGSPKYGLVRIADDGTHKITEMPKNFEPKGGPGFTGEVAYQRS